MSDTPELIDYDPLWAKALRQLAALGETLEHLGEVEGLPPIVARAVAGLRWAVANGRAELQSDFLCLGAADTEPVAVVGQPAPIRLTSPTP